MIKYGKQTINQIVTNINTDGCTDIARGIILEANQLGDHMFVLTDGEQTVGVPASYVKIYLYKKIQV